jgi:hypothetical protein
MKYFFLFLSICPIFAFQERFFYPQKIDHLFENRKIWEKFENKTDFQKFENDIDIKMKYKESFLGYSFISEYNISRDESSLKIFYKNKFVENNVTIQDDLGNFVNITIDTKSNTIFPSHFFQNIVKDKLHDILNQTT